MPYFFYSTLVRAWNNVPGAYESIEYKLGKISENESIFASRPEYLSVLATMNLKDPNRVAARIKSVNTNEIIRTVFEKYPTTALDDTI